PIEDEIYFGVESSFEDRVNISLLTTNGAVIYRASRELEEGENEYSIDATTLPKGVYFLDVLTLNKRKRMAVQVVKVE
ncbi:MAG: T9SS type A sorting domain-containing protein, partial [Bacteroidota bacterium]